ncbi:MAG: MazG nucleotide pyrophosphohydrolase domain-containing protein [Microthrixaceae bacterium]
MSGGGCPPVVHVVGLGPGGVDLVTAGTLELIDANPHAYLRTRRHPAASLLADATSFDDVYDRADRIEDVYPAIVEALVDAAQRHGEVVYAVPGSPLVAEHTVELLLGDPRVRTVTHAGLSFLDLTWVRLGVDPVEMGARLVDGHRFAVEAAGERGPLLVAQCDSRFVLSDIKLSVEDAPDEPVTVLQRLGLPDESVRQLNWWDLDREVEPDHLTSVWIPDLGTPVGAEVVRLDELVRRLRVEDPWKAAQTHDSLKRYLLEESYEVFEAIDDHDPDSGHGADELCAELGDLLYQVVFHSAIAAEAGWFTLADVASGMHDKLVRRHPHVFDPGYDRTPEVHELIAAWESDKRAEMGRGSIMDGIPTAMPALARALKVLRKAESIDPQPRSGQLAQDQPAHDQPAADPGTLGRALWALVESAHAAGLDPEDALRVETDRRIATLRDLERRSG